MVTDIRIERLLTAGLEDVYAAWTRTELLARWYCPNPALELKVDADVRVGGAYVVEMGPYVLRGSYLEADPPHRLAFTWKWDADDDEPSTVRVELSKADEGTRMLLLHSGLSGPEDAANHLQSWEPELDRLEELLTSR